MPMHFSKLHGLGNDYVYVSTFDQVVDSPPELARRVSDRHRGVGSDGLILIAPPEVGGAHVRMIMYNADGSRAEMCGNGVRCVAKLAYETGLARQNPLRVQTDRGVLTLALAVDGQQRVTLVRVDMGEPILEARRIPVTIDRERVVGEPTRIKDLELPMTCVSMGNPHVVFFHPDIAKVPLAYWGPAVEHHHLFPERINVHFAQVLGRDRVRMVTWERGSGITSACGTGASAVCVAAVLNSLTAREITVELPGGELKLEWSADSGHVFMTGPAVHVYDGVWLGES